MRLVIFVSDGHIEEIVQEGEEEIQVVVLDDYTEGLEDDEVMKIGKREYFVAHPETIHNKKIINQIFKKIGEKTCLK